MKPLFLVQVALVIACLPLPETPAGAAPVTAAGPRQDPGRAQRGEGYEEIRQRAEERFREGSYQLALGLYEEAAKLELTEEQRRWVDFRLADTRWRSAAQSQNPDASELDRAAHDLRAQLERYERPETRDDLYAELHESLGDASWRRNNQDWGGAWSHYSPALDWWARSSDLERARERYLGIVWRAALPPWREEYWGQGYFPSYLPVEVLANALEIASRDEERVRAHYLLGRTWINQASDRRAAERVQQELGAVLELGKSTEWYDDALHALGTFHENRGRWERDANGGWQPRPDFVRALELYRRLVTEFRKGETRYFDDCQGRIRQITSPALGVQVDRFFLPGSEVQYALSWRNLEHVELALHPVELTRDVAFASADGDDWLAALQLTRSAPSARWTHDTHDPGKHEPGQGQLVLAQKPGPGAYVLHARGPAVEARTLVLVSDAAVTVKVSGTKLLAWATDVRTGAPLAEADLRLFERWHDGHTWRRRDLSEQTGADGTALFELSGGSSGGHYLVALKAGARQAFAQGWIPGRVPAQQEWRVYAYTDRSAYRPGDEVQWKLWARTRFASAYRTPAGETVAWEVRDPQGTVVSSGTGTLNAFGAAWGSVKTTAAMPLGKYTAQFFRKAEQTTYIGAATLFRLEEYKLPEYEVAVKTPLDSSGKPKLFRLGERVEVEIESTYYYGAPVAGAAVEVFVHQRPRYRPVPLHGEREFPWFYDDQREIGWWGGPGQQVLHETRQSDPAGKVTIDFDTPPDGQGGQHGELEYTIEARVVDASRREIVGNGRVIVAELGYRVEVEIAHAIHRPGERVRVDFRALDPNDNPVEDDGHVEVTRERWVEIWHDSSGREVLGDALERVRSDPAFPAPGWGMKFQGYEREPVAKADLRTGKDGKASFEFTPPKDGYYRVVWTSTDDRELEIRGEGSLFVADERTTQLGYLPGGIEILVDQDTLEVGKEASILLVAPTNGRWVLFTVEGEELYQHQVFQLSGQVKLVKLPITELHVPNVFLGALSMFAGQAHQDAVELIVPPVKQFLSVELITDQPDYEPGAEGNVSVTVKDRSGEPVSATLSFAVVDEAVAYIQGDYAMDPRRFFYGEKRQRWVQTGGSFQHGWYGELVKDEKGEVRDRRIAMDELERDDMSGLGYPGERRELAAKAALGGAAQRGRYLGLSDSLAPGAVAEEAFQLGAEGNLRQGGGAPAVRVRSDFRETALWLPDVTTDKTGRASVRVKFPDSTTRWKATVRGCDAGTRVGEGSTSVRTRQPLIARLQAPRFFVVGDELTISGNLNNNLALPLEVETALTVQGLKLLGYLEGGALKTGDVPALTIPASGQVRVDWRVAVVEPGTATLKLAALGQEYGDALERTLPVYPHGIEASVNLAGSLDTGALALTLDLPEERRADSTSLEVTIAPSLAVTMLDALPYLADYPYGCVEQTLSRFLPAVIVAKTLRDFGLSAEDALSHAFGGIESRTAAQTHKGGKKALEKLDEMTKAGLERLYDFQHSDGGWAWWKDGESNHFMTAYVLWGLALARDAGLDVRAGVLENAARFLAAELVEQESELDLQAWMLHSLAAHAGAGASADAKRFQAAAFDNLWKKRDSLNAYGRALFALAAHAMGRANEARTLLDNLKNGVILDRSPDTSIVQVGTHQPYTFPTAHWGQDGIFHRWSEGGVEATAFALRAFLAIAPQDELVQPVMNWLVKNRRGAQWSNTRDTAISVLALDDYLQRSGELGSAVEFELAVNGRQVATKRLEKDQLLTAPSAFPIDRSLLRDGANEIRITKKQPQRSDENGGPLYFSARARFFSLEEPLPACGNELFVRRDLYRLAARKTLLAGTVYERVPLLDGDTITSGERVEVVLTIEAKNELEYLVFEDLKPAGLEAVQVRSGEPISAQELKRSEGEARFGAGTDEDARRRGTARDIRVESQVGEGYTGRARSAHQELRDRQVAFFLEKLPQGLWELRYELRAETPGRFHALPLLAHAMYVPEIRANGEELRLSVVDAGTSH